MSEYTWRVMKHNRFAGYVLAVSEWEALQKANDYYGKYVWVERLIYGDCITQYNKINGRSDSQRESLKSSA